MQDRYQQRRPMGGFTLFPPVLKFLLFSNIAVFILQYLVLPNMPYVDGTPLDHWFMRYFALFPVTGEGAGLFMPWQMLTYQYMHGGLMHLFFNMFALWMFGSELEQLWGSKRFFSYYTLCGLGAALVQMFIADRATVGASGSIYGILLAFGLTFPNKQVLMFPLFIPIPARIFVIIYAGIELFSGITGSNDGVAHFAHLGGAAMGFLLIKVGGRIGFMKIADKVLSFWVKDRNYGARENYGYYDDNGDEPQPRVYRVNSERPVAEVQEEKKPRTFVIAGEEITQSKIDIILDKISASGYQSLTEKEKNILLELSKKL